MGTTAVTSALGFAYWWLAARQFSLEAVGFASAAISAMTLLGTFGMMGLGTLLIGELPNHRGKEAPLINAALILAGGVGGCLGILYAVVVPHLSTGFQALGASIINIALFALGVSLTAITLVLDQALMGLLRGELQLWRNALFAVVKLAALFVTSLWLAPVTGLSIYVTWIIGSGFSMVALAGFVLVKRGVQERTYLPQWLLLRRLGSAALKHHALNLTLDTPSLLLPVLVTILLSARVNAWFYVSWSLASVANAVSVALAVTLYAVSSAQPSTLARKMRMTLTLAFGACVLINCVLLLGSKQVLDLFGHSYSEQAVWSLRILSLESFPFIIKNHYIALSRIRGQITRTILVTVATGLFELGGSVVGGRLGGINGLSLGWTAAISVEAVFMSRAIYNAAWIVKTSPQVISEQNSLGTQAIWLVDTLVLAAINPSMMGRNTDIYQMHLRSDGGRGIRDSGNGRYRLRPTRLERFSSSDRNEGVQMNKVGRALRSTDDVLSGERGVN